MNFLNFQRYFYNKIIYCDVSEGLPFSSGRFSCVIVTSSVEEYVKDKVMLLREVKRLLQKDAMGYITTLFGLRIEGMSQDDFFTMLGSEYRYHAYPASLNLGALKIINTHPENNFPHLELVSQRIYNPIDDFDAAPEAYICIYRYSDGGQRSFLQKIINSPVPMPEGHN